MPYYTRSNSAYATKKRGDLLHSVDEVDELAGGHFGFDEVGVGLFFDVFTDVFTLVEVGGDDNLGFEVRCDFWVAEGAQNFDTGDVGYHEVQQNNIVLICLGFLEGFGAVSDDRDIIATLGERARVELANEMFVFDAQDFATGCWVGSFGDGCFVWLHRVYCTCLASVERVVLDPAVGATDYFLIFGLLELVSELTVRGNGEAEGAALAFFTVDGHDAAVCRHNGLA
jgi:hypothetical protein